MLDHFRVEIDVRHIRLGHTTFVLRQEIRHERGEGVQLHAGDQFFLRIALAHGIDGRLQFGRAVCKVFVCHAVGCLADLLQTVRSTGESTDLAIEIIRRHTDTMAS